MNESNDFNRLVRRKITETTQAQNARTGAEAEAKPQVLQSRRETIGSAQRVATFLTRHNVLPPTKFKDTNNGAGWVLLENEVGLGTFHKDTELGQKRGVVLSRTGALVMHRDYTPAGNLSSDPARDPLPWVVRANQHRPELAAPDYSGDFSYADYLRINVEGYLQERMVGLLMQNDLLDQFGRATNKFSG